MLTFNLGTFEPKSILGGVLLKQQIYGETLCRSYSRYQ